MITENVLARYYSQVQEALYALFPERGGGEDADFSPGPELPELTPAVRNYLAASEVAYLPMPQYREKRLSLLDLTRNPGTGTTKTFPSLVMVARAVRFIQDTGQRVTIVTPSSANKGVALRDAVLRAITCGLVTPDQLNVIVIVPSGSAHKLRSSELLTDADLRGRNPIAVYNGPEAEAVKAIAREMVDRHRRVLEKDLDTNLWYTLQLENYLAGDVVRALSEAEFFPADAERPRLHAHAVSSAYGFLGHAYGREMVTGHGAGVPPRYFLVQHLAAPDMVVSLYGGCDAGKVPTYVYEREWGGYAQRENPHFPRVTFDPEEVLDTTFYSRNPVTSPRMNSLIEGQGGGGIVVSLAECLERYGQVRSYLKDAGLTIPANPTSVLEWSVNMAMTGVFNAIDRGLLPEDDILIHGSGVYGRDDFEGVGLSQLQKVENADALRDLVLSTAASTRAMS
ncbi:hypothetical protein AV521_26470 [Streptomyces sp. IMTB 2501]|uniref:DUF6002 family protein n=1 Tax=Streptomyces sp. IMTB 2501 TaxID=1776340 RepID=UPI00096C575C|nr:DUF6002 family protein [Streptomyces sp. IMTB 2501]OLZ66937.1 hypothetical protein AV521_26470 [Streptomyces sp. IMTB 2501]